LCALRKPKTALHDMILANEPALRMMLTYSLQRGIDGGMDNRLPAGKNRPLIEAAIAPSRSRFMRSVLKNPSRSLALIIATEAIIVCKDVLQLSDAEAGKVKHWASGRLWRPLSRPVPALEGQR
jgi:hypothetical protein